MLKCMAEPAGASREHNTLEVMNSGWRSKHKGRGETDPLARCLLV